MNEQPLPQGEFHHFQLVGSDGEIPFSISLLVHFNPKRSDMLLEPGDPITTNDIIEFHEGLKSFDGDFIKAFSTSR